MPEIFHIATVADWNRAQQAGTYTTSTLGRTLEEEGFIHCARREQLEGVRREHYASVREPLVVLAIETGLLRASWREDEVGEDWFPHVYGPIHVDAVTAVTPLPGRGRASFTGLFFAEMLVRVMLAFVAMLLAILGTAIGRGVGGAWGPFLGGVAGLAVGAAIFALVVRRRH